MERHPSFDAPLISIEPLRPFPMMEPYKLCWCLSGKKYKWCHLRRETKDPINIFEIEARMNAELEKGYCLYPQGTAGPCGRDVTMAHTIQRKGGLALVAESSHVLTPRTTMAALLESSEAPGPRMIGTRKASVFPGFCNDHDSKLFKLIEAGAPPLTQETAFLFSYRAMSYELFHKEAQQRRNEVQRDLDYGLPFINQAAIQSLLHNFIAPSRLGLAEIERRKREFDEMVLSGNRDIFNFALFRCDTVLPIVGCGAFFPEFDLAGRPLQLLARQGVQYDFITLTVTSYQGQTIIAFGWSGGHDGPSRQLVDSFLKIDDKFKADAILRLLFVQSENIYLRPSWWNALDAVTHETLSGLALAGTTLRSRSEQDFASGAVPLMETAIVETLVG